MEGDGAHMVGHHTHGYVDLGVVAVALAGELGYTADKGVNTSVS